MSGTWDEMGHWDIFRHTSGVHAIVKDVPDWHLHKSEVEREARERFGTVEFDL